MKKKSRENVFKIEYLNKMEIESTNCNKLKCVCGMEKKRNKNICRVNNLLWLVVNENGQ